MKKILCIAIASLILLCGCTQVNYENNFSYEKVNYEANFSYEEDHNEYYDEEWCLDESTFVNSGGHPVNDIDEAIELAKNERIVNYDTIDAAYDPEANVYRIVFYTAGVTGGCSSVYLDANGSTLMIVPGE